MELPGGEEPLDADIFGKEVPYSSQVSELQYTNFDVVDSLRTNFSFIIDGFGMVSDSWSSSVIQVIRWG